LEITLSYALGNLELTGVKSEELPDFAARMSLKCCISLPLKRLGSERYQGFYTSTLVNPFHLRKVGGKVLLIQRIQGCP
jgi:hypothetical protein